MAFFGMEVTGSQKEAASFRPPPGMVLTVRAATLVTGGPCALWIRSVDVEGELVERCMGYLDRPFSKNAELVRVVWRAGTPPPSPPPFPPCCRCRGAPLLPFHRCLVRSTPTHPPNPPTDTRTHHAHHPTPTPFTAPGPAPGLW